MQKRRTVAIIQARMGSSRYPGKVLADLHGKPVIWHLLHRICQCKTVDQTVLATSDQPEDDDLASYVSGLGFKVVRGSESNVLERLCLAARASDADIIVRVTGDAPLVDPASLDAQVVGLQENGADFCVSQPDTPNVNEGFEAFTTAALTKLEREASDDPIAIEHTCTYFKKHPGFVKALLLEVPEELQYRGARVSVDTPSDLAFLNLLYERLAAAVGELDIRDVVCLLRREPELTLINHAVRQKAGDALSRTAMIRCDTSPAIGLGHLVRCLALAEALREEQSLGVTFVTKPSELATQMIAEHKHRHIVIPEESDPWLQLEQQLQLTRPDVLILDVRDGVALSVVEGLRQRTGVITVSIDDPEEKRLACDLLFYPPVPQVARMDWSQMRGEKFVGWDWVLLRRQFHAAHEKRLHLNLGDEETAVPRILITMGGSDPAGMTMLATSALNQISAPFHAVFVLGGSFCHEHAFQNLLARVAYSFEVVRSVDAMAELMVSADMAVACFSVTAYELATVGLPAVFLSLTDGHYEASLAFEKEGMGISLGRHDQVNADALALAISEILMDRPRRVRMSKTALSKTDGLGAKRIAEKIINHLHQA